MNSKTTLIALSQPAVSFGSIDYAKLTVSVSEEFEIGRFSVTRDPSQEGVILMLRIDRAKRTSQGKRKSAKK